MSPTCTAEEGVVLSFEQTKGEKASPTVPVRWCISADVLESLATREVTKPYILILVCQDRGEGAETRYREVDRAMFPISQMMGFLQFHRPGAHTLFPVIVWNKDGKRPGKYLTRDSHGDFDRHLFDSERGEPYFHTSRCECQYVFHQINDANRKRHATERDRIYLDRHPELNGVLPQFDLGEEALEEELEMEQRYQVFVTEMEEISATVNVDTTQTAEQRAAIDKTTLNYHQVIVGKTIDIEIDDTFFAPEPSGWESWWVNLWFRSAPLDQCDFRRRRILAYTVQPLVIGVWIVLRTLLCLLGATFCWLFAVRGVSLKPIFKPFETDFQDTWADVGNWEYDFDSVLFSRKDGERRTFWFIWGCFTPIVFVVGAGISALYNGHHGFWDWKLTAQWAALSPLLLAAVAGTVFLFCLLVFEIVFYGSRFFGGAFGLLGRWIDKKLDEASRKKSLKVSPAKTAVTQPTDQQLETWRADKLRKELSAVVCTGGPIQVSVAAIPKGNRTFKLEFSAFKAKICQPYRK